MKLELVTYLTLMVLSGICIHSVLGRKKRREKPVVCEPGTNTFYHSQAEKCLECDKCNEGYSLVPLQEYNLKMDPVHGALNCLPCRKCLPGTYNDRRTFELTCRTCRNCTALRKIEESPCTPTANAICGDDIEFPSTQRMKVSVDELRVDTMPYQGLTPQTVLLVIIMSLLGFLILFFTAFIFIRRAQKHSISDQNTSKEKGKKEEVSLLYLNNSQGNVSAKSKSTDLETINMTTENEETRPKEKIHTRKITLENVRNHTETESNRTLVTNKLSESTIEKTPKLSNSSSWYIHTSEMQSEFQGTQFTIGYTNLALSRSLTCPSSDKSSEQILEDESMDMLSEFSYVLD
ncbi:uncharacterized protein LOC133196450 [Saccostrea echinata]|uniref:uncharacterized protein LOC133196450 n=1 Tax=Saccostrea echinata TaxID=191078 RepID=UPI002A7F2CEF|nr:uncharacterized protein LOC133196450 [Saccostrea echinata]